MSRAEGSQAGIDPAAPESTSAVPAALEGPAGQVVSAELPCQKCGYLLRGLSAEARCPECGTAILQSLMTVPERELTARAVRALAWSRVVAGLAWIPIAFSPRENDAALVALWLLSMAAAWMLLSPAAALDLRAGLRGLPGLASILDRFRGMAIVEALLYLVGFVWWFIERRSPEAWRLGGQFLQEGGPYFPLLLGAATGAPRAHQMYALLRRLAARCRRPQLGTAFVWMAGAFFVGSLMLLTCWRWFTSPYIVLQLMMALAVLAVAAAAVAQPVVLFRLADALRTVPAHWRGDTEPAKP